MKKIATSLAVLALCGFAHNAMANGTFQPLPFSQNWSNIALITVNDDWSSVPGVIGFLGNHDLAGAVTAVDPQTLTTNVSVSDTVIANQAAPNTLTAGGVAEFDGIADPVVALNGSGTADAPYIILHINTGGFTGVNVSYNLRDIDASADNASMQVVLQYRLGVAGAWTNVAGSYVADASAGPSLTLSTPVSVALPAACDNQAQVQLRVMTTNAAGNDEWIGIDDISISGTPSGMPIGVNLGWNDCGTTVATSNRLFACNDNLTTHNLVGSFKLGYDIPDFVGVSGVVDVTTSGGSLPAWWQFGPGGCREGALSLGTVGALAGCVNPYSGGNQGGGFVLELGPAPDRFRVRFDWVRDTPAPVSGTALNSAFVLSMSSAGTVEEGFGICAGCNVPACMVLNALEISSLSLGRARIIENADVRNWASWQGGTGTCPGATDSRKSTWGAVKTRFR
ncbi:MAG: hypothetical protein HOP12_05940 [Candidatus Eisenbacteria bacterium]|uniref:Uncharacterized protein n=1 Tax=Eiseniibacteriota bacterium TaxID=2212470 RepID=A0A849SDA1_UNCEI|nr:hypothetical protein [Candidatus Eisenbacteria bacterium]